MRSRLHSFSPNGKFLGALVGSYVCVLDLSVEPSVRRAFELDCPLDVAAEIAVETSNIGNIIINVAAPQRRAADLRTVSDGCSVVRGPGPPLRFAASGLMSPVLMAAFAGSPSREPPVGALPRTARHRAWAGAALVLEEGLPPRLEALMKALLPGGRPPCARRVRVYRPPLFRSP